MKNWKLNIFSKGLFFEFLKIFECITLKPLIRANETEKNSFENASPENKEMAFSTLF